MTATSTGFVIVTSNDSEPPSLIVGLLIEMTAESSFVIVPVPVSVDVAPVKVTSRPLALRLLRISESVSLSSTSESPLIVTSTV